MSRNIKTQDFNHLCSAWLDNQQKSMRKMNQGCGFAKSVI